MAEIKKSIISIDDNYRICSVPNCWQIERLIIQKKGKKIGKEYWKPIKFYASFNKAVDGLAELFLKESVALNLNELINASEKIRDNLTDIVNKKGPQKDP